MNRTMATLIALTAAGLTTLTWAVPASAHADGAALARVRAATAKYHDISVAVADGFTPTEDCVPGMGYHYVNFGRVADGAIKPTEPEILLYVPSPDGLRLGGVEYMQDDADQNLTTDGDRPSVFGQPFEGPMLGHEPGQPIHYDKHVWIWQHNPAGAFSPDNPRVTCP
jgi:hypothetical protein